MLIGLFGVSAVLMCGTRNFPFSQPRNLIDEHSISAIVGVISYKLFFWNIVFCLAFGSDKIHNLSFLYFDAGF